MHKQPTWTYDLCTEPMKAVAKDLQGLADAVIRYTNSDEAKYEGIQNKNRTTVENARLLRIRTKTSGPTHESKEVSQGKTKEPGCIILRKLYKSPAQSILDQVALQTPPAN